MHLLKVIKSFQLHLHWLLYKECVAQTWCVLFCLFLTSASAHKFLQGETSAETVVGVANVKGKALGRRTFQPDGILWGEVSWLSQYCFLIRVHAPSFHCSRRIFCLLSNRLQGTWLLFTSRCCMSGDATTWFFCGSLALIFFILESWHWASILHYSNAASLFTVKEKNLSCHCSSF